MENRCEATESEIRESIVCAPKMTCWCVPAGPHYHGRARRSHGNKFIWHLQAWDIEFRAQRLLIVGGQTPLLDVPDHADDLRQPRGPVHVDALADRILVGEVLPGKDFVDHDY